MNRWAPSVSVALVLGVVSFAFAPILVRWAGDVPALTIAVWRTVTAAVVLAPGLLSARARAQLRTVAGRDLLLMLGAGGVLGFHFLFWIESLGHTTVASASIFVTSSPLLLAGLSYLLLGERLSTGTLGAIGIAVGGAVLIGWSDAGTVTLGEGALWGNSLALGAAVLVGVYLLVGRVVRQSVGWWAYVFPVYGAAAVVIVGTAWVQGTPLLGYSWRVYGLCIALALGPQVLGHGAFNYALQRRSATLVGLLALLEPVGASGLAYVLFDEQPPLLSVVGMTVVLGAVAVVVWRRNRVRNEASRT
jgi:drug/metabolite transporter (DMT)-like permease